jgi:hypothetical protein
MPAMMTTFIALKPLSYEAVDIGSTATTLVKLLSRGNLSVCPQDQEEVTSAYGFKFIPLTSCRSSINDFLK